VIHESAAYHIRFLEFPRRAMRAAWYSPLARLAGRSRSPSALLIAIRSAGAGCRVQGAGFRVQGAGFRVQGSGFRVQGSGVRVQGSGFGVQGSGFRVQGSGFRVPGSGFHRTDSVLLGNENCCTVGSYL